MDEITSYVDSRIHDLCEREEFEAAVKALNPLKCLFEHGYEAMLTNIQSHINTIEGMQQAKEEIRLKKEEARIKAEETEKDRLQIKRKLRR